uniref:Uncharacterized protein n=1 Tax=Percolomonas cosmopolitus TaxID=63605 RepID=A0A7S1KP11_9EUKA
MSSPLTRHSHLPFHTSISTRFPSATNTATSSPLPRSLSSHLVHHDTLPQYDFQRSPYVSKHLRERQRQESQDQLHKLRAAVAAETDSTENAPLLHEYQEFTINMGSESRIRRQAGSAGGTSVVGRLESSRATGAIMRTNAASSPHLKDSHDSSAENPLAFSGRALNFSSLDDSHLGLAPPKRKFSHDTKKLLASDLNYAPHRTPQKKETQEQDNKASTSRAANERRATAALEEDLPASAKIAVDHMRDEFVIRDNLSTLTDKSMQIEQSISDMQGHSAARTEKLSVSSSSLRRTPRSVRMEDTTRWQHQQQRTPPVRPAHRTPAPGENGLPSVALNVVNTPHTKTRRVVHHRSGGRHHNEESFHHTTSSLSLDDLQGSHNVVHFGDSSFRMNGTDLNDDDAITTTDDNVTNGEDSFSALQRTLPHRKISEKFSLSQLKFYHDTRNRLMKQLKSLRAQENVILEQLDVNARRTTQLLENVA